MIEVKTIILGGGAAGLAMAHQYSSLLGEDFIILEERKELGGTWDQNRFPGLRCDSTASTYQFNFFPAHYKSIWPQGDEVRDYLKDLAQQRAIYEKIHFNEKVLAMDFSTENNKWQLTTSQGSYSCQFVINALGFINHNKPFFPELTNQLDFKGEIIHCQNWPQEFSWESKNLVVVGGGTTSVTLVPAIIEKVKSITLLQRRPGYFSWHGKGWGYKLGLKLYERTGLKVFLKPSRWYAILSADLSFAVCYYFPKFARFYFLTKFYLKNGRPPKEYNPTVSPWQTRMLYTPDYLTAMKSDKLTTFNHQIQSFGERSVILDNGNELPCDALILATGFHTQFCGGCTIAVDQKPVPLGQQFTGPISVSGIPNFFNLNGYYHNSYFLKVQWQIQHVIRMMRYMSKKGMVVFQLDDEQLRSRDRYDQKSFNFVKQSYFKRSKDFPRNLIKGPMKNSWQFASLDYMFQRFRTDIYKFN